MRTSESQSELVKALFAAKAAFPRIAKTKRGQSGNRSFNYAPLDEINDAIDPMLRENGLMITQGTDGHQLTTRLEHISGEWREMSMPINAEHANMQSYGIEVTYRRRYSVQLILGIVTEEDIDIKAKERRGGVDHTVPAPSQKDPTGSHSGPALIFSELPPDVQMDLRTKAPHVDACMPDAQKAKEVLTMIVDEWPDVEANLVKTGLWYLLDSKTRSAIKGIK